MATVPDPATTEWVPLFSTQAAGVTLTPHHATHEPGGSDPIAAIATLPHHASHEPGGADALIGAAWTALQNIFTTHQIIQLANPKLTIIDTLPPANLRAFDITNSAQGFHIRALDDALTAVLAAITISRNADISGIRDLTASRKILAATLQAAYILSTGDIRANGNMNADGSIVAVATVQGAYVASTGNIQANGSIVANATIQALGTMFAQALNLNASAPRLTLNDTAQPVDLRMFDVLNTAQLFIIRALNDAQNLATMQINIDRAGNITGVNSIGLNSITVSGNLRAGSVTSTGPVTGSYVSAGAAALLDERAASPGDVIAAGTLQGAAAVVTGNVQAGSVQAGSLGTTPLNADRLASGTVPDARIGSNIVRYPLPPSTVTPHASTHANGGADPLGITSLPGFPGGTSRFLRADGVFADPPVPSTGVSPHAASHRQGSSDPVSITQAQVDNLPSDLSNKVGTSDPRLSDARTPTSHRNSHYAGGSDAMDIKFLGGYVGNAAYFLDSTANWSVPHLTALDGVDALMDRIAALEARIATLEAR